MLRAEFRRQLADSAVMAAVARVVTQDAFDRVRELEEYIKSRNLDWAVFYHFKLESVH